jgi:hypothetical protein
MKCLSKAQDDHNACLAQAKTDAARSECKENLAKALAACPQN